jgi:hypothetical protein
MTWPRQPLPAQARALLLLPSGHRAFDEDFTVAMPAPKTLELQTDTYHLMHLHAAGGVDQETRALYVLGGRYEPHGFGPTRHAPDEAFDQ